ncbi:chitin synthesis regulation, resistance to congo red-domain-containing protein [Poronia punctata]|nr:chitin synthesis regulation, resistance to congo red-domain-containing protein [Poronia punctata]
MAPAQNIMSGLLYKRWIDCPSGTHYSSRYNGCVDNSPWNGYGRWVFTAVIIALFFLIFFLWALRNTRRRRRRGTAPLYGTGWMAPNHGQQHNNPHAYNQGYNQQGYNQGYHQPPPAYGAQPQPSYPMENYGQQASGVEPPKNVYSGDYAPPAGPPPGK